VDVSARIDKAALRQSVICIQTDHKIYFSQSRKEISFGCMTAAKITRKKAAQERNGSLLAPHINRSPLVQAGDFISL